MEKLASVYVWQNGMVMAFDQLCKQMPYFQGHRDEVWPRIEAARQANPDIIVHDNCAWPSISIRPTSSHSPNQAHNPLTDKGQK